jgi:site-specific DNA-methyltransferase (adenine-specific)
METNRIICGDNCEVMRTMPSESIDLVVTSPPYDNLRTYGGHPWDFEGVAQELWRLIKPGGIVVWVVNDATVNGSETGTSFRQALRFMDIGFRLHDTMIYATDKPPMNDNRYQACFEYMFVISRGKPKTFNAIKVRSRQACGRVTGTYRQQDGSLQDRFHVRRVADEKVREAIWYVPGNGDNFGHPAMFPEGLARDHILSWSNEGDIVLDPFSGSGTTAKMAKHNGRQYIGIEVNPEYVEISLKRLEQGVLF